MTCGDGKIDLSPLAVPEADAMPVCQLRIKLRDMSPPVWRRIVIDAEASLANLHEVIQRSMSWEDDHQHRFMIRGRCFNLPQPGGVYYGGAELKLSAFGFLAHERFVYEYGFCSHWMHDVRLGKMIELHALVAGLELA